MRSKEQTRWYNEHRDPKVVKFYQSGAWQVLRQYKLNLNPLCECCDLNGLVKVGEMVHHMIPIDTSPGWEHRLDLMFLQSLCNSCHNTIENEIDADQRKSSVP